MTFAVHLATIADMGVWGTAVFSNDDASDLRDEYRALLGDGISGPEATDKVLAEWRPTLEADANSAATFWLALAVTQWKCGRLEERVKREAIRVIENGDALAAWNGSKFKQKRAGVLNSTRELLNSQQPAPRKIAKRFRATCDWKPGDLIAYQLRSGSFIVFQTIELHEDKGGVAPVCELFDWIGDSLPSAETFAKCSMRAQIPAKWDATSNRLPRYRLMILHASKREFPETRIVPLRAQLTMQHPPLPKGRANPTLVCLWRELDNILQSRYGFV